MQDVLKQVRTALEQVVTPVRDRFEEGPAAYPCAVLYESENRVVKRCDSTPHLHEIELTVEIRSRSLGETHTLCALCDEKMRALGFYRSSCMDLQDEQARVHRRVALFRALVDENGTVYQ